MNLEELRTARRTERQKDTLQHLRDSFYRDVAEYIENLKERRKRAAEQADDPFGDPEVGQLSDEIETAEEVVESLYERRVGKVVKLATFAAADMGGDEAGLTDEERTLYEDLVARIRENREAVLDTLAGENADDDGTDADSGDVTADASDGVATPDPVSDAGADDVLAEAMGRDAATGAQGDDADASVDEGRDAPPDPPDTPRARPAGATAGTDPATDASEPERSSTEKTPTSDTPASGTSTSTTPANDAPEPGSVRPDDASGGASDDTDRTTVRITRDVGEIFGVDQRSYDLEREDVVMLPADNADPLLRKDAAERLD